MSKYKVIQSEFTNAESLLQALKDVGLKPDTSPNLKANGVSLAAHWHGEPAQECAIAIQQGQASKKGFGYFDGIGFVWNGSKYEVIRDGLDMGRDDINAKFNQIKQRYATAEVKRQARLRGYSVTEQANADGTIKMSLVRR